MYAAALALLAVAVTLAILVGKEAAGSATLDPPFLSGQPCVVMLALIPCAAALIGVGAGTCSAPAGQGPSATQLTASALRLRRRLDPAAFGYYAASDFLSASGRLVAGRRPHV